MKFDLCQRLMDLVSEAQMADIADDEILTELELARERLKEEMQEED